MSQKSDKSRGGSTPPHQTELSEGARGGVVLPIQTAPLNITNQVGGLPPADNVRPSETAAPVSSTPSSSGQE